MGINHVIRGEDRVTNTGPQIQISAALAGTADLPAFGHHNLLTSASGEGLSKRSGALSLAGLREAGIEALAVVAPACLTNSFELIRAIVGRIGAAGWMFRIFSRRATKFDVSELFVLSARAMAFNDVRSRPSVVGVSDAEGEAFWLAVRGNLSVFTDVGDWINVVFGKIEPPPAIFCRQSRGARRHSGGGRRPLNGTLDGEYEPFSFLSITGRENGPELAALCR
jgi:glutamyl-tRNA synthetase